MDEKYINQIVKKLRCSKGKREEIRRQLTTDFMAEVEQGEDPGNVMKRMGEPWEIAEEFNRSFPEEEQRKYKREKGIKTGLLVVVLLAALAAVLYWFLPKSFRIEDSKVFQKETVWAQSEKLVRLLDSGDYAAFQEASSEKLQEALSGDVLENAKATLAPDWGAFQSFGTPYIAETSQMGVRNAVVQVNASYEKVSVTYTLCFDEDMKLTGIWMK